METSQTYDAAELLVIPRARFAEWLARKYLEGPAISGLPIPFSSSTRSGKRGGVEYYSNRPYELGDRLKDIDWKHSFKFQKLIVKEYREAWGLRNIVAVNLETADVEEADELAYNLIMVLLTLAQEGYPVSIAAYCRHGAAQVTPPLSPQEGLLRGLRLMGEITLSEPPQRFLAPPDLLKLRRFIEALSGLGDNLGSLLEALKFQRQALERAAEEHPASRALCQAIHQISPPATITLLSNWGHDAEPLAVMVDRLHQRGYTFITLGLR
jgi:uncharacterized protein (DUF58 family)